MKQLQFEKLQLLRWEENTARVKTGVILCTGAGEMPSTSCPGSIHGRRILSESP